MTQEPYSNIRTHADSRLLPGESVPRQPSTRIVRHILIGLLFMLLLTCLETLFWLFNPGHLFGYGPSHTFSSFVTVPLHMPIFSLIPLSEVALGFWLSWSLAQPLALLAYLRVVRQVEEKYRERYTPLQAGSYPYEVPILYTLDNPDPTLPRQTRSLGLLELVETVQATTFSHLLLLGAPGAGKTMFLHEYLTAVARQRRLAILGRFKLPLLLPLKYYALFFQTLEQTTTSSFSLLDFLTACDLPGLEHLRPYLGKLFHQGRLHLLCDGLDEVPETYRPVLELELIRFLRQERNSLLLTCTPQFYAQSSGLMQAVGENLVPCATLQSLEEAHIRGIVERFIAERDAPSRPRPLPTAGQIMSVIQRTRLRFICTTPFALFSLLDLFETLSLEEVGDLDTRGRLFHAFLKQRLEAGSRGGGVRPEDLLLLRDLACLARWNGDSDVLCLPAEGYLVLRDPVQPAGSERIARQVLGDWSREQLVPFPFAPQTTSLLAETFPPEHASDILRRVYQAALIEMNPQGIVEFRHALIAAALLAEYLASFLGAAALHMEEVETFPGDFATWSEPIALWAGLLDYPFEASGLLARWAGEHAEQRINALLASLICLGVAQTPPGVDRQQPLLVPPELEEIFGQILDDQQVLAELADLVLRCAEQGVPELYQALFPLLAIDRCEVFINLLDPRFVLERFFLRLEEIIDEPEQEFLAKRLVRALSSWGGAAVPRAASLCSADSGVGGRLRTAAINVLGGTHDRGAVEPLMACLYDTDPFITRRAANALARLGPDLTLQRLLYELETLSKAHRSLPAMILPIIERFLNETEPERQLQPAQFELCIDTLLSLLTTHATSEDLEQVRALLVRQGRLAGERDSGKITLRLLVESLAHADDAVARKMTGTLKEVGQVATPNLLEQLEAQTSAPERVRILEVLASVRDERALPVLLRLLADNSPAVQQALVLTLTAYVPACIPDLIDVVLQHSSERVATRAGQVLTALGAIVVEPVMRALTPPIVGRTLLLVRVLEQTRDARIVPPLIALLSVAQADIALLLAIMQVLGQYTDERVVTPLLDLLASTNPLLYEGAINALSNLGEMACVELLPRLASSEKTPLITRIERVLLGMQPFPGERLLEFMHDGSEEQVGYIEEVFLARGIDAAQVLAANLFHHQPRLREHVRRITSRMDGRYIVPALLEVLSNPDPDWRELVASYLLVHSQEAIPALVALLDDPERNAAAAAVLLQAGRSVLPALIPALDSAHHSVQEQAIAIVVTLVHQQTERLMDVVQLFGMSLSQRVQETLMHILTEDLAEFSLPFLLKGLEDAHLVSAVSSTLVRLARRGSAWSDVVLEELLQALRLGTRRYGATLTLVELGTLAVQGVGSLITDPDPPVARAACQILVEIGTPALPFIWAAHSDASNVARRETARDIFRAMPTSAIIDELVVLLSSARQEEISMALALLLERIHDEALQQGHAGEMLPALLEYVQSSNDGQASLRILALLILLGSPEVARALLDALYANTQRHEHLVQSFLFLEQSVETELLAVLRDADAPIQLRAELAGILAMRVPNRETQELALGLSEHGLWAGRTAHHITTVLQPSQLEISLRALGGLLVAGHWDVARLQDLHSASKPGSAERELYDILLGWRYNPQITRLAHELELEQEERKQEIFTHTQELLAMKAQLIDLEHELEMLKAEHEEQHRGHEEKSKELQEIIADLTREKVGLQNDLRQVLQEKQELASGAQQAMQEKSHLQAEVERWQVYSQQLERDLTVLRRPGSNA